MRQRIRHIKNLCPLPSFLRPMPHALRPMPHDLRPLSPAPCPLPSSFRPPSSVFCSQSSSLRPLPVALCPLPHALPPHPNALSPLPLAIRPDPSASGFTLMEILVALTVTAIVFTALFGVFDRVMNVAGEVDRRAKLSQEARLVMMQFERDLGSIVLNTKNATQSGTNATNATQSMSLQGQNPGSDFFDPSVPVLTFSTSSSLNVNATFPHHRIYAVAYWFREAEDGSPQELELFRAQRPLVNTVNEQDLHDWEQVLLSSHISSLRLSFFDPRQSKMLDTWGQDSSTQQPRTVKAPPFVFIQARFESEDGMTKEFMSLHHLKRLENELTYFPDLWLYAE